MAKFRPAGSKKAVKSTQARGAIPCLIIIIFAIGVVGLLFYFTIQSSSP